MAARKAVWARRRNLGLSLATATTQTIDLLTNLETNLGRTLIDVTVGRILLSLGARSNSATGDLDLMYGVIPLGRDALAVGGASVPDPASNADMNKDWMLWGGMFAPLESNVETPATVVPNMYTRAEVQTRSMRKLRAQQGVAIIFSNNSGSTVDFDMLIQMVVLL